MGLHDYLAATFLTLCKCNQYVTTFSLHTAVITLAEHPRSSIYLYTATERLISGDSPLPFLGGDGMLANFHQYIPSRPWELV
ncbi:MAG: hypothetical protein JW384_02424 [Nitrosomonadaceae bacterium]|nr:hypothetical protein [Nitrosomonadaceae bacterium]